jgi:hypothetical protein
MSSVFTPATPDTMTPDPSKHVNFTLGMLLGVDDLKQEFAYLNGRNMSLAREAIGYGTMCGLKISLEVTTTGPRLSVTSGTALSPRGELICMHPAQCAMINDWLSANQAKVKPMGGSPPGSVLSLWLVLCYRDCPTDPVPIAGEPCRSADDLMAPSRLVDDFLLELRLAPPVQQDEDAIRLFASWLDQVQVADIGPFTSLSDFENALRADLMPTASPLTPGGYFQFGSPLNTAKIPSADVGKYFQSAFRIWTTEIRPLFHLLPGSGGCGCCCGGDTATVGMTVDDKCLLLAEVDVPVVKVGPNWQVDDLHPVVIDESKRPILLPTRMLQQWLLSGLGAGK